MKRSKPDPISALPEKSVKMMQDAISGKDIEKIKQMLYPENKGWRAMFEASTGTKLPKTLKGSWETVEQWAANTPLETTMNTNTLTKEQIKALGKVPDCVELDGLDGTWDHVVYRVEHPVSMRTDGEDFYTLREAKACQSWLKRYAPESEHATVKLS